MRDPAARCAASASRAVRRLLGIGLIMLTCAAAAEPLRIVVPTTAGGSMDYLARMLAQHLPTLRGEPVIVLNRPGADTAIGSEYAVQAQPPERTLLVTASYLAQGSVQNKFRFDPATDLKPVIKLVEQDAVLVARQSLPVTSVAELVRYQESGHRLSCGAGVGQMFFACLQLRQHWKGNLTPISYNGTAKLVVDVAGGHVDLAVFPTAQVATQIASGRLRPLAATGGGALGQFENLPRIDALWPDIDIKLYIAVYAPGSTPDADIARWNADINTVLRMDDARQSLATADMTAVGGPPEVLRQTFQRDVARFRRLVPLLPADGK